MNPESSDYYLIGHCIDGRVLYPATGYLVLAWRTLARSLGITMEQMPVVFEEVTIHQATILPKKGEGEVHVESQTCTVKTWERWAEGRVHGSGEGEGNKYITLHLYPVIHPKVGFNVVFAPCCAKWGRR